MPGDWGVLNILPLCSSLLESSFLDSKAFVWDVGS